MPLDGQRQFVGRNARAVVRHADQRQPAGDRHHLDLARAGIDGVLDQLLDDAGRPLDHLTGGDPVDGLGTELPDGHGGVSYCLHACSTLAPYGLHSG